MAASSNSEQKQKPTRKRSRSGCHNCKRLKIKCDEQKPVCKNCVKYSTECDYSLKLSWGGRPTKRTKTSTIPETDSHLATEQFNGSHTYILPENDESQTSSPAFSPSPGWSLSNESFRKKISDFDKVFQPSPQQKPIINAPFIIQYPQSFPTARNLKATSREPSPLLDSESNISSIPSPSTFGASSPPQSSSSLSHPASLTPRAILSEGLLNTRLNAQLSPALAIDVGITPNSPSISLDVADTDNSVSSPHVSLPSVHQAPFHFAHSLRSDPGAPRSGGIGPVSMFTDASVQQRIGAARPEPESPQHHISELTALDSLNRLLDEESYLQDRQFVDDYIISEHAFHELHETYRSALMQVPLRNSGVPLGSTGQGASSAGSSLAEGYSPTYESGSESDRSEILTIPQSLTPLPDMLIQVPVYRELFYHFVNVTADTLVPVPRLYIDNPFRVVLPRIAMSTPHLMSLIVAYAATNRAKIFHQSEPVELINRLLERTFHGLTRSLENEKEAMSDTTLATAIMLCSYSIITSAAEDSWKTHLHGAREIVMGRGIADSLSGGILTPSSQMQRQTEQLPRIGPQPLRVIHEDMSGNEVLSFLIRVFAYIDVIGALSSSRASSVLTNNEQASQLWTIPSWGVSQLRYHGFESWNGGVQSPAHVMKNAVGVSQAGSVLSGDADVDLLLGIDLNMIPVLSKVAALARRRWALENEAHFVTQEQAADEDSMLTSEGLELSKILISCCSSGELSRTQRQLRVDSLNRSEEFRTLSQLSIMNQLFGYAALIHLYRRVLKFTTDSEPVRELVSMITSLLDEHIPPGDSMEACMSFPMFTAACESHDEVIREKYRMRMKGMQRFGLGQVDKALHVMEECWARNESWMGIVESLGLGLVLA